MVADKERTEVNSIRLAVHPSSLKAYGNTRKSETFEVVQRVKKSIRHVPPKSTKKMFYRGESWSSDELKAHPELAALRDSTAENGLYMDSQHKNL